MPFPSPKPEPLPKQRTQECHPFQVIEVDYAVPSSQGNIKVLHIINLI